MVKILNRPRCVLDEILDRSNFSPTTREKYEFVIGKWLEFAGTDPRRWTHLRAQAFYDQMLERGVKVRSANVYIASLRYVSKWFALHHGGQDFAIVQTREGDKQSDRRALSQEEVEALLATCTGDLPIAKRPIDRRDRTLLIVGLETGMRRMSLAGMQLENIVEKRGPYPFATVPIKGPGGRATFDVPLSDTAMLALKDWTGWLRSGGVDRGPVFTSLTKRIGSKGHIEYSIKGGISLVRIYKLIEQRAEKAKIEHVHPHLLRNTFITWRMDAGLSGPQIASITGHQLIDPEWRNLAPYLDMKVIGEAARQSTPPWFANHVRGLLGKE